MICTVVCLLVQFFFPNSTTGGKGLKNLGLARMEHCIEGAPRLQVRSPSGQGTRLVQEDTCECTGKWNTKLLSPSFSLPPPLYLKINKINTYIYTYIYKKNPNNLHAAECEFHINRNICFTHGYIPGTQKSVSQHMVGTQQVAKEKGETETNYSSIMYSQYPSCWPRDMGCLRVKLAVERYNQHILQKFRIKVNVV